MNTGKLISLTAAVTATAALAAECRAAQRGRRYAVLSRENNINCAFVRQNFSGKVNYNSIKE